MSALQEPIDFFVMPYPNDLRLDADGTPALARYPRPDPLPASYTDSVDQYGDHFGPTQAVYFRFEQPLDTSSLPMPADTMKAGASIFLVDVTPGSAHLGEQFPVEVEAKEKHLAYIGDDWLAVHPVPGYAPREGETYAVVVTDAITAKGSHVKAPAALERVLAGKPTTQHETDAVKVYAPLVAWLATQGQLAKHVAAATVYTTQKGSSIMDALRTAVNAQPAPTLAMLAHDASQSNALYDLYTGVYNTPNFQQGTPPYSTTGGMLNKDASGNYTPSRTEMIRVAFTIPKGTMPAAGWPLYQFFHGSGGLSTGLVDLGHSDTSADNPEPGKGPGYVVALHGIAAASSALPLNPERLPGASDYAYLNISNLAAFPETFQQGVFEQRLFADALSTLSIPKSTLAGCSTTAAGNAIFFDQTKLVAGGQSMGGMYTNMTGAVEPRWGALVPTGAGGFWNLMILESETLPNGKPLLAASVGVDPDVISFLHPSMNMIGLAWEIAEPIVYMSRLAHRPLPGMPVHDIYEPVGMGDSYFPADVYDAAALSYENQQVGPQFWPTMQDALATEGLDGLAEYSVHANRDGHTRVVVQYQGDGIIDAHYLYRQLDTVKHQYGCFLESFLRDGVATVPAPGGLMDPCP